MANSIITLGIGTPGTIPDFITFGLAPATVVLLTGGDTGYTTGVPAAAEPSLVAPVPAASPLLVTGPPASAEPTYRYNP